MGDSVLRVAIHQPNFNPYLGFLAKLLLADRVILLDTVQFVKNEFQNRNRIRVGDSWQWLTVPVLHRFGQRMDEVLIDPHTGWKRKHLRTLEQSYARAPRFQELFPQIEDLYRQPATRLLDWNLAFLEWVFQEIGINSPVRTASEMQTDSLEPNARLLSLVRECGGGCYLAGEGGSNYMDREFWLESGIQVRFLRYHHPTYPQIGPGFVPYCGVLDLLFMLEPEEAREGVLSGAEIIDWPSC